MTDLEIIMLCAKAMKLTVVAWTDGVGAHAQVLEGPLSTNRYHPLSDDAQAMALVKKMKLTISPEHHGDRWGVGKPHADFFDADLNRAICLCVADMQQKKVPA